MVNDLPGIAELDLNPVIVTPDRRHCRVVDSRIRVASVCALVMGRSPAQRRNNGPSTTRTRSIDSELGRRRITRSPQITPCAFRVSMNSWTVAEADE